AFFFITFSIFRHPGSRLFLQRTIIVTLVCAIFVSALFFTVPSIFNYLIVHGRPFIEPRADLTGLSMGFASILFLLYIQSGKQSFESSVGDIAAGNNEFRAVWWKSVIDETNEKSPVFGLGFGYDLAKRFLRSRQAGNPYEFDTRSPHSIVLTIYGRMGLIGIL